MATIVAGTLSSASVTDQHVHDLMRDAAPYILVDREHDQTVYRLAHRTFAEHFTSETNPTPTDRDTHHHITTTLLHHTAQHPDQDINPYIEHYLSAHAGVAGQAAWTTLAEHPAVLDRLNPTTVAADAMRTAFGFHPLPPAIAGIIGACHHVTQTHSPADRRGLRHLAMTRHTTIHQPAAHEPNPNDKAWAVHWAHLLYSPTHRTLTGHTRGVHALAAVSLPDGRTLLATSSYDNTVRLWDPTSGHQIGKPIPVGMVVTSAAHVDGDVVAVGTSEGVVVLSLGLH